MPKELNLNEIPSEVLKVTIGDDVYTIPLASDLPYNEVKKLVNDSKHGTEEEMTDLFIDFFKMYIPEDIIDNLPMAKINALAKAWGDTSGGIEQLGES